MPPSIAERLKAHIPKPPETASPADLAKVISAKEGSVRVALRRMLAAGTVTQDEFGAYSIAPDTRDGGEGPSPTVREPAAPFKAGSARGTVTVPAAPFGHGASSPGRHNGDGPPVPVVFPEAYLRVMTGGNIPRYPDGRPRLLLTHAVGDSMAPFIPDGHPVLVEMEAPFVEGARYALWLGDVEADVIKRVEIGAKGVVTLRADNPNVRSKTLIPTDAPGIYRDEAGDVFPLTIRGRVLWPFDTGPAVVGQLADFARSIMRQ